MKNKFFIFFIFLFFFSYLKSQNLINDFYNHKSNSDNLCQDLNFTKSVFSKICDFKYLNITDSNKNHNIRYIKLVYSSDDLIFGEIHNHFIFDCKLKTKIDSMKRNCKYDTLYIHNVDTIYSYLIEIEDDSLVAIIENLNLTHLLNTEYSDVLFVINKQKQTIWLFSNHFLEFQLLISIYDIKFNLLGTININNTSGKQKIFISHIIPKNFCKKNEKWIINKSRSNIEFNKISFKEMEKLFYRTRSKYFFDSKEIFINQNSHFENCFFYCD